MSRGADSRWGVVGWLGGPGPAGRLVAFAGLAILAAAHWATLLVDPPVGALAVVVVAALVAAVAMIGVAHRLPAGRRRGNAVCAIALSSAAVGLIAVGFDPSLLLPSGWDRLASELDAGLGALSGDLDYPFDGTAGLARPLLLAGLPLLLALALIPGFWPGRRSRGPRYDALALMIAAYAVPATVNPGASQGWVGFALLLLIAAWLFAPRLARPLAVVAVVLAGLLCVPLANALEGDPWLDYRNWELGSGPTNFEWEHSYGPIDWPRTGETLFTVRSREPRYWRADVLEGFDGRGWVRDGGAGASELLDLGPAGVAGELKQRWIESAEVEITDLEGIQVIGPGTGLDVEGVGAVARGDDGRLEVLEEPLGAGSKYSVEAYVPDPSARAMRAASGSYDGALDQYTTLIVPERPDAVGGVGRRVEVPVWGSPLSRVEADAALTQSPYSRMAALARRLSANASTAYDAARAIESYLRINYVYSERPDDRPLPLDAFLFEDRIGYCQQFSGAMAAMLRTVGVPSRVATGFTPGRLDSERNRYEVSDLDAHSWVEVYFTDIGWVPFDPTPSASPARAQLEGVAQESSSSGSEAGDVRIDSPLDRGTAPDARVGADVGGPESQFPWEALMTALLAAALLPFGLGWVRARRYRRLDPNQRVERGVAEVERIAAVAAIETQQSTTLWRVADRMRRRRHRTGSDYVEALARCRYGASGQLPSLAERRRVRAELAAGSGILKRVKLWWELPPGGPRAA